MRIIPDSMRYQSSWLTLILAVGTIFGSSSERSWASSSPELKTFRTADGAIIAADVYKASKQGLPSILLLHMLRKSRASFSPLVTSLSSKGYGLVNADLRGHGQSVTTIDRHRLDYRTFNDNDWLKLISDSKTILDDMSYQPGLPGSKVILIGSSIGANALASLLGEARVIAVVLLSPGDDYHGIRPGGNLRSTHKPVLMIAGTGDEYSAHTVSTWRRLNPGLQTQLIPSAAHGNDLLGIPGVVAAIDEFVDKNSH